MHPSKASLADLRRLSPPANFSEVLIVLNGESDAAAVLLATAQVDLALQEAIEEHVLASTIEKSRIYLFEGAAPLSSLEAKNHLCYAIGIYGEHTRADLFTIARLRNIFAHAKVPISFSFEAIRNTCLSLRAIKAYQEAGIYRLGALPFSETDPRTSFVNTCLAISIMITIMRKMQPDGKIKLTMNLGAPDIP